MQIVKLSGELAGLWEQRDGAQEHLITGVGVITLEALFEQLKPFYDSIYDEIHNFFINNLKNFLDGVDKEDNQRIIGFSVRNA